MSLIKAQNRHIACTGRAILAGGAVAYPTEAVYGLGCLPLNESAVRYILHIKRRPKKKKGLILVAASVTQILSFIADSAVGDMARALHTWPGPVTWVFPASKNLPIWLRSDDNTIAVRVSANAVIRSLCRIAGPLISTSANRSGAPPARNARQVSVYFPGMLDYIYPALLGPRNMPTEIRNLLDGRVLRKGAARSRLY